MSTGSEIVTGLQELLRDIEAGKPVTQTMMRRMVVKGKTVYMRETYKASIGKAQKEAVPVKCTDAA